MATFIFIIGLVVLAGGIGYAALGRTRKGIGVIAAIVGLVFIASTSFSTVSARSLGVQTSLGKYHDTLSPGFQVTAPWTDVEEWTTRNQVIRFAGDGKGEERDNFFTEPRITVRLGNQSEAYVDANVTWKISEQSVGELWKQHKTFGDARRDFTTPAAQGAVNAAFDGYNPLANINAQPAAASTDGKGTPDGYVPVAEWSKRVTEALRPLYKDRNVELVAVQVTFVKYDAKTEEKLQSFSNEIANTRIATQAVETAKQQAIASKERAAQASPGCSGLVRDLAAQDQLKNVAPGVQICEGVNAGGVNVNAK